MVTEEVEKEHLLSACTDVVSSVLYTYSLHKNL